MSVSVTKAQAQELFCVILSSEATYSIPFFGSRDAVTMKNATADDMTLNCQGSDTVDGATSLTLKGYSAVTLTRGATEWKATNSYDQRETAGNDETVYGDLTVEGETNLEDSLNMPEATAKLTRITGPASLTTTTSAGLAFTNQPANDGVEVVSSDAGDTTQTVTIIGTTTASDTVVVETVTLNGTTAVPTVKTDWGVILAVKKSAATLGTVTVREASGDATITAGLTAAVLSVGVETVDAANQAAYNRVLTLVASGSTTKQLGLKGTDTTDAVIYDSQALSGTTSVLSNEAFRTVTEIYTGDLEATRTATITNDNTVQLNGANIGYRVTGPGTGTAYNFTNTAAAITFGTTSPSVVLNKAGTYRIAAQVHVAYNGATVAAETATIKVRRTNNTAADLSQVLVIDLPAATTLTHSYGTVLIPPFYYTTSAVDDAVSIFANVSAALGAGTIDATAIGTSIDCLRVY